MKTTHRPPITTPATSGIAAMAVDLAHRYARYPDVLYAPEHYMHHTWGIRSTYILPETGEVTSWMNYHSHVKTEADIQAVITHLNALDRVVARKKAR